MVTKDIERKKYSYISRYSNINTVYNTIDKKRYYETSKSLSKDLTSYLLHTVNQNDTLDTIALQYYNNPTLWWIIADINDMQDSLIISKSELIIPDLNQIKFI